MSPVGSASAEQLRAFGGEPIDVALRASRPQSLIITIFGAYSRGIGGWLSVATLLPLMAEVGVEDAAVRSALSRFKRRGVLLAQRHDGNAGDKKEASVSWAFRIKAASSAVG